MFLVLWESGCVDLIRGFSKFKTERKPMKFRKALVWSLVTGEEHPSLTEKERTIEGVIPLVQALFPGVNYYSITGFGQVMRECVAPVLEKRFHQMKSLSAADIKAGERVEVAKFLPSNGYEWQDSAQWRARLTRLLAAA